jgi:hypothetical protein
MMWRALAVASVLFWASTGFAQSPGTHSAQAQAQTNTAPQPKIDGVMLAVLIKSSITAVQHANATGNYSVLRDLGTPIFRERYDQAKLTEIFANLRARGVNLSPALMLLPNLTRQPEITPQGQLHVVGNFPTQPLQIQYELVFLQLDGIWRLDGIAVDAVPVANAQAAAAPVAIGNAAAVAQDQSKAAAAQQKPKGKENKAPR